MSDTASNPTSAHTSTTSTVVGWLDGRLRRPGESRDIRLRKTATFSFAVFTFTVLTVYLGVGIPNDLFLAAGLTTVILGIIFSAGTIVALLMFRDVRNATIYAHLCGLLFGVLYPVAVAIGTGVGLTFENGDPKMYQFIIIPVVPSLIAFMLREKRAILLYALLSAVTVVVVTLVNPRGDDLTGAFGAMIFTLVIHLCVSFVLAFFSEIAENLQEEQVLVKGRMKNAVRQAKAERRANEAKTRFVSVMSHEIRNPLQAILLQLEMLETTALDDVQGDYVAGITRASNVLLTIVNDILDVTKIESGAIALESIPMSLRDVVEFTLHTNAPKAAKQGVELICSIDPSLNTSVLGDPTRIRQVLHNFVGNALKFTTSGEVEVTLSLENDNVQYDTEPDADAGAEVDPAEVSGDVEMGRASRRRMQWKLSVRDTGIGIDEAGKQKLFQEFSQVDETTTRMYGGTGLGLFICKELSEIMGGHVSVESEPGVGSTFSSTFMVESSGQEEELPVHIVSSDVRWTVIVYVTNSALTRNLKQYLRFFFTGVKDVQVITIDRPKVAEQRIRALLKECSPTNRLVVLANHSDCTNSLVKMLTANDHGSCVPVVLSDDPVASVRRELETEGWRNVVHKPVSLRQLCSTLDRAISDALDRGTLRRPASNSFSSGARKLNDGTLTRGMRVPTATEIAEVSAVAAAKNPDSATILIVDDFELVRSLVQQVVTSLGYNTIVAANGKQAVDQVRANYDRIAMVLMDCEMPIMDGYEATEAIRAIEVERGVPAAKELFVCAMTANAMREDVKKCFSRRMSGFLAKPVKRSDLETILQENAKRSTPTPVIAASPARARRRSHASDVDGDASGSSSSSASRQSRRANRDRAAVAAVAPGITLAHPSPMHTSHSPSRRKKRGKAAVDQDRSL
jgi:signal transduction histidine kinase/CheY-like chemotaxis protein